MDPIACWKRLCDALYDGEVEEACIAAVDMMDWLRRGGHRHWGGPDYAALKTFASVLLVMIRERDRSPDPT